MRMWFHTFMVWLITFTFKIAHKRSTYHRYGYGWNVNFLNFPCISIINANARTYWLQRMWYKLADGYYEDHLKYGNGYGMRKTWKGIA